MMGKRRKLAARKQRASFPVEFAGDGPRSLCLVIKSVASAFERASNGKSQFRMWTGAIPFGIILAKGSKGGSRW